MLGIIRVKRPIKFYATHILTGSDIGQWWTELVICVQEWCYHITLCLPINGRNQWLGVLWSMRRLGNIIRSACALVVATSVSFRSKFRRGLFLDGNRYCPLTQYNDQSRARRISGDTLINHPAHPEILNGPLTSS